MKRKGIIIVLAVLMATGMAFASGDQDNDQDQNYGRGYGRMHNQAPRQNFQLVDPFADLEETTVSGAVEFTAQGAELTVDGEVWNLRYPRRALYDVDINNGDTITVTGYQLTEEFLANCPVDWQDENVMMVTSAEINGETYELDARGFGGRGGMKGGRGGRGFRCNY